MYKIDMQLKIGERLIKRFGMSKAEDSLIIPGCKLFKCSAGFAYNEGICLGMHVPTGLSQGLKCLQVHIFEYLQHQRIPPF